MIPKTATYEGAGLLQTGLPHSNVLCSDGDGLSFNPTVDDINVDVLAYHTHQPLESNNVLWNNLKLYLTRQTLLGNYTNILTQQQADAGEDGTTTGFVPNSGANVTSSTDWAAHGTHSIKVTCPGSVLYEGVIVRNSSGQTRFNVSPSQNHTAQATVKGTGTVQIMLREYNSAGTVVGNTSKTYTLSNTPQTLYVTRTMTSAAVTADVLVITSAIQNIIFYCDEFMVNPGSTPLPWIPCQTSAPIPTNFELVISLLGLGTSGDEALIGEKIINTCPQTPLTETITFPLKNSACKPDLDMTLNSAPSGKIQINLPMRAKYYEYFALVRNWLSGWPKRKPLPVTGGASDLNYYPVGPITIFYVSGMKSDFSDLRFASQDGQTNLPYWIEKYIASSSATVYVMVPEISANVLQRIYPYYANSSAVSASNFLDTFQGCSFKDDFEDGKLTGRSSPYKNWTVGWGNAVIETASPISGNYSLKHTGNGSDDRGNYVVFDDNNVAFTAHFKFKLSMQGTGSQVFVFIPRFVDFNNMTRIYTYAGATTQKIAFQAYYQGVGTEVQSVDWLPSQLQAGTVYDFYIVDTGTNIKVWINGVKYIDANYVYGPKALSKGIGANQNNAAVWDNFWVYPSASTPTIGSLGNEESTITVLPDAYDSEDTNLLFTPPLDWVNGDYAQIDSRKVMGSDILSHSVPISPNNVIDLGYESVSKYYALRTKIEGRINSDYKFNISEEEYEYYY